jgi:apolipoprotein N-acyltransferase
MGALALALVLAPLLLASPLALALLPPAAPRAAADVAVAGSGAEGARRIEQAVRIRAALLPGSIADTSALVTATAPADGPALDVLLVQGSIDTELKHDPDAAGDVAQHYDDLTMAALDLREGPAVSEAGPSRPDLIVWPETMWRWGLLDIDPDEVLVFAAPAT